MDPERDSNRYMAILVEALSILGKVQDALDVSWVGVVVDVVMGVVLQAIQQRMEKEFLLIIEKASIQVTRTRDQEEGQGARRGRVVVRENMPKQLTKMLQICFERFHAVVSAHEVLLSHFQHTKRTYKGQCSRLCVFVMMIHDCDVFQFPAPYKLYKVSDVWVAIQRVVRHPLTACCLHCYCCRCKVPWRCI